MNCPSPEYLAGYFDGEGCVFFEKSRLLAGGRPSRRRVVVTIGNTFEPMISAIASEYGGYYHDSRSRANQKSSNKPFYQCVMKGRSAARFLTEILPYLHEKSGRASAALFALDTQWWARSGRALSPESLHVRSLVGLYFSQKPNGHCARKGGGLPGASGRKCGSRNRFDNTIFNSALSAKAT